MSILSLCGFGGRSVVGDLITMLTASVLYSSTSVPNAKTSWAVRASASTGCIGYIPWDKGTASEFWIHGHHQVIASDTVNDKTRLGWASGSGSILGFVRLQDATNLYQIIINGVLQATSATGASIGTHHSWLIHVVLHGTTGTVDLYIDGDLGTPVVSWTGNTDPTAAATADGFYFGVARTGDRMSNLVCMDPTDATGIVDENSLLNVGLKVLYPDADGFYSAWTPDTGGTGYTQIDEAPLDDADYVEATAINQRSTFSHAAVGEPIALASRWVGRVLRSGTDAGANLKITRRLASTDYDEATQAAPGSGVVAQTWDQKAGGGGITATDLDNTEYGVVSIT